MRGEPGIGIMENGGQFGRPLPVALVPYLAGQAPAGAADQILPYAQQLALPTSSEAPWCRAGRAGRCALGAGGDLREL
jgi:hypothetical protein